MNKVASRPEKLEADIEWLRKQINDLANAIDYERFCNPGLIAATLRTIARRKGVR